MDHSSEAIATRGKRYLGPGNVTGDAAELLTVRAGPKAPSFSIRVLILRRRYEPAPVENWRAGCLAGACLVAMLLVVRGLWVVFWCSSEVGRVD